VPEKFQVCCRRCRRCRHCSRCRPFALPAVAALAAVVAALAAIAVIAAIAAIAAIAVIAAFAVDPLRYLPRCAAVCLPSRLRFKSRPSRTRRRCSSPCARCCRGPNDKSRPWNRLPSMPRARPSMSLPQTAVKRSSLCGASASTRLHLPVRMLARARSTRVQFYGRRVSLAAACPPLCVCVCVRAARCGRCCAVTTSGTSRRSGVRGRSPTGGAAARPATSSRRAWTTTRAAT
jgi:hypothetical protein